MNYKRIAYWTMITMLIIFSIRAVLAYPNTPGTITADKSGYYNMTNTGFEIPAQAGNITAMTIYDTRSTIFWQGYYGNVTGRIVLDDAANNTMYAWELATPAGEIYAANTSNAVRWDNLTCVNLTGGEPQHKINGTTLTVQYNMNTSLDPAYNLTYDSFNMTFNETFPGVLAVGGNKIGDDDTDTEHCPMLYTFIDNAWQTNSFRELLTFDNDSALVFVTFIENSLNGYEAGPDDNHDFQMMVAEDGTPGKESTTTPYYFYLELE